MDDLNDIAQADIFFFITSIAVIAVSIAVVIAIYYMVKVIEEVRAVVRAIRHEITTLTAKRRQLEVHLLTAQKVVKSLAKGGLFRSNPRPRVDE